MIIHYNHSSYRQHVLLQQQSAGKRQIARNVLQQQYIHIYHTTFEILFVVALSRAPKDVSTCIPRITLSFIRIYFVKEYTSKYEEITNILKIL